MSVVINEVLRRTSAMYAERRKQRFFYEGGQDYLERRRESARLSRAGGVAAAADSEDGPVGEDQVHMVPSLLRISTSDGLAARACLLGFSFTKRRTPSIRPRCR